MAMCASFVSGSAALAGGLLALVLLLNIPAIPVALGAAGGLFLFRQRRELLPFTAAAAVVLLVLLVLLALVSFMMWRVSSGLSSKQRKSTSAMLKAIWSRMPAFSAAWNHHNQLLYSPAVLAAVVLANHLDTALARAKLSVLVLSLCMAQRLQG